MSDQPDIYGMARLLIREHGAKASERAARQIDVMMSRRDLDGQRTWRWVLRAVDQLQAKDPPEGTPLN